MHYVKVDWDKWADEDDETGKIIFFCLFMYLPVINMFHKMVIMFLATWSGATDDLDLGGMDFSVGFIHFSGVHEVIILRPTNVH